MAHQYSFKKFCFRDDISLNEIDNSHKIGNGIVYFETFQNLHRRAAFMSVFTLPFHNLRFHNYPIFS